MEEVLERMRRQPDSVRSAASCSACSRIVACPTRASCCSTSSGQNGAEWWAYTSHLPSPSGGRGAGGRG